MKLRPSGRCIPPLTRQLRGKHGKGRTPGDALSAQAAQQGGKCALNPHPWISNKSRGFCPHPAECILPAAAISEHHITKSLKDGHPGLPHHIMMPTSCQQNGTKAIIPVSLASSRSPGALKTTDTAAPTFCAEMSLLQFVLVSAETGQLSLLPRALINH